MDSVPSIVNCVFGLALISALILDSMIMFQSLLSLFRTWAAFVSEKILAVGSPVLAVRKIIVDFSHRRYYNPLRTKDVIFVWSKKHITELSEAPELSQRAVYSDIFNFEMTLKVNDPNERLAIRYRTFGRVLQTMTPPKFQALQPHMQSHLERTFSRMIKSGKVSNGWTVMPIASLLRNVATQAMGVVIFGDALISEPEFGSAMFQYPRDMIRTMACLQIAPKFLAPALHAVITNRGRAMQFLLGRLLRVIESEEKDWNETAEIKPLTVLHSMAESGKDSSYWDAYTLAQALLGIWFAASHQPWVNLYFIFNELCARQEYVELLREELSSQPSLDFGTIDRLPLLDAFIKEAIRIAPSDRHSIRRKALRPFKFSDGGPHVPVGSIACVSQWDILHDQSRYPKPDTFDPLRFVNSTSAAYNKSDAMRFTDVSENFPMWGYGSRACPGRFHASYVIKMSLTHMLLNYDFRFADETAPRKWHWESFAMPYESTKILFRERAR